MNALRRIPCRGWMLIVLVIAFGISAIGPDHPRDFILEHTFTVATILFLIWFERRRGPLTNLSYSSLFVFILLHILGAHYTYSNVPYDMWTSALFGGSLSEAMGWQRNHYDRLVHLCFGLLITIPMHDFVKRTMTLRGAAALIVAVAFIAALSKIYELIEWIFSEVMSAEAAEMYNGQQGDMYDAQKDMALALAGSIFTACVLGWRSRGTGRPGP